MKLNIHCSMIVFIVVWYLHVVMCYYRDDITFPYPRIPVLTLYSTVMSRVYTLDCPWSTYGISLYGLASWNIIVSDEHMLLHQYLLLTFTSKNFSKLVKLK